jgi:hypothetical protein
MLNTKIDTHLLLRNSLRLSGTTFVSATLTFRDNACAFLLSNHPIVSE